MNLQSKINFILISFMLMIFSCAENNKHGNETNNNSIENSILIKAKDFAQKAGPYVINCCSGFAISGKTTYMNHRMMQNNRLSIDLCVNWTSKATTCDFQVCGELNVNMNGCNPEWIHEKIEKRRVCILQPGCRHICTAKFSDCL